METRQETRTPTSGRRRTLAQMSAGLLAVFAIACGDGTPTTAPASRIAPTGAVSRDDGTSGSSILSAGTDCVQALLRSDALLQPISYTKIISSNGGKISVPEAGFELEVPSGAFAGTSMTFTVTAYAGQTVAYDFQPHGVVFRKPLRATQQLAHTNWGAQKLPSGYLPSLTGAYFADTTKFNLHTGWGIVDQFMSTRVTDGGSAVTWDVPHFSGYIVASGRQ